MSYFCYPTGDIPALKETLNVARSALSEISNKFFSNESGILVYSGSQRIVIGEDPNFDYNWGNYNNTNTSTGVVNTGVYFLLTGIIVFTQPELQNDVKFFDDQMGDLRLRTNDQKIILQSTNRNTLEAIRKAKAIMYRSNEFQADSRVIDLNFFGAPYAYRLELKYVEEGNNYFMADN